jgi:hypothetical protein
MTMHENSKGMAHANYQILGSPIDVAVDKSQGDDGRRWLTMSLPKSRINLPKRG